MKPARLAFLNAGFTVGAWLLGVSLATLAAYIHANIRGDLLPDGTIANGGPMSLWVSMNFRSFLPAFWSVGSVLGLCLGQVQFWMWLVKNRSR